MSDYCLFLERVADGYETTDTDPLKVVECMECAWFVTYFDWLWTSNEKPDQLKAMLDTVRSHAKRLHKAKARIVKGWKA
jgi:hypothetical protein